MVRVRSYELNGAQGASDLAKSSLDLRHLITVARIHQRKLTDKQMPLIRSTTRASVS